MALVAELTHTGQDELNEKLLHAAAEVFAENGYEKAGVAEIARRAGVTTGAIYSRYSGKAELLVEAVDRHLLTQLHSLHSNASAVDVLSHLGDHLLDDLSDGTGLFLEAVVAAKRDPELAERLRDVLQSEENKLRDLIHEAISQEGADSEIDQLALMRLAHAIGFGMTLTRTIGLELPSREDWTTVINLVIEAFIRNETENHGD
ncbi:MAG: TetR/AcrR family transcriptional regulator [Acidimicrobiales bacterium]|jgi:TetR/AcrR family transcriptional repressor of uid operon|nr:TetR/AcrR family transcriptional regulator [Acidimicrobiales bacterium]|tara:strand:+ start:24085 stop:24696 length:612 start_codon:yes stop_codon:yes gene_type:complete